MTTTEGTVQDEGNRVDHRETGEDRRNSLAQLQSLFFVLTTEADVPGWSPRPKRTSTVACELRLGRHLELVGRTHANARRPLRELTTLPGNDLFDAALCGDVEFSLAQRAIEDDGVR